ncbi:MAG: glutamate--tRNA ligase family protein, partial [Oscillospiraceae bacterium]
KYNLLYKAFNWDIPKYLHCPPVMKDSTQKLSKRNGDASYQDLIKKGYLTEAILNYIALLGWSPKGEEENTEIMSLDDMCRLFSIHDVSKSPAIFDVVKLNYINAEYLRRMSPEEFLQVSLPWIKQAVKREDIDFLVLSQALQPRCEYLSDIPPQLDFIDELPQYDLELYTSKKMKTNPQVALDSLKKIKPVLESLENFKAETIHEALFKLIADLEVKNGIILWPLRVAVSGKQFTPGGGIELADILGKAETLKRIDIAIELLSK